MVIDGVKVIPLRRIQDERGCIYHMMKATDEHFKQFGEIYFSSIYSEAIKGWHKHDIATLSYTAILGTIKLVIYDERQDSPTKGEIMELFIGENNYCLVQIPPGLWNGFKAIGGKTAIVANCCSHPHGAFKSERLDPIRNHIPYDWDIKNE